MFALGKWKVKSVDMAQISVQGFVKWAFQYSQVVFHSSKLLLLFSLRAGLSNEEIISHLTVNRYTGRNRFCCNSMHKRVPLFLFGPGIVVHCRLIKKRTLHLAKCVEPLWLLQNVTGYSTFKILICILPFGVFTATVSPALCPRSALPMGDSLEMRPSRGFASRAPTIW